MTADFNAIFPDKYQIILFDNTPCYQDNIPETIHTLTLDVASLNIPNGRIPDKIDLLAYFYSSEREDNNLYILRSEDLGLGESQEIPDGIYEITYSVNNTYEKVYKFLIYRTVEERTLSLIESTNYNVTVGSYDLSYVGETCEGDVEKIRLASTLLDELRSYSMVDDETNVLNTLDKLQRLLTLIENEII